MQFSRKRLILAVLAGAFLLLAIGALALRLRPESEVKVRAGTKIVCIYGETLKNDVKELLVSRSEAGRYRVIVEKVLCDRHRKAQEAFERAQKLAREGKKAEALKAFKEAASYDPDFRDVKAWIASGGASGSSSSGNSSGESNSGSGASSSGTQTKPVALTPLLPASLDGYESGPILKETGAASRTFMPLPKKHANVSSLVVRVYDFGTTTRAQRFIDNVSRKLYSKNPKTVGVNGAAAYFGTQPPLYATLAWRKGQVVREIVMGSAENKPQSLLEDITWVSDRVR